MNFLSKFFLAASSLCPVEISQRNYLVFFRQNSKNESSLIDGADTFESAAIRYYRRISTSMHSHAFAGEHTVHAYPRQVIKCRGMHRLYPRIIFFNSAPDRGDPICELRACARETGCTGIKAVIF